VQHNKYQPELHCNEVTILPYYIANLNIEATFQQQTGYYKEFKNICFVDTLDNIPDRSNTPESRKSSLASRLCSYLNYFSKIQTLSEARCFYSNE